MSATKPGLFDDLRALKAADDKSKVDWTVRKKEWLEDLDVLMGRIQKWLEPGVKEKLLRVTKERTELSEEYLGGYEAPSLRIEMPGSKVVHVKPVGALIIGAAGRVDMTYGPRLATLLRTKERTWKFRAGSANTSSDYVDANEDTFTEAMRELIK